MFWHLQSSVSRQTISCCRYCIIMWYGRYKTQEPIRQHLYLLQQRKNIYLVKIPEDVFYFLIHETLIWELILCSLPLQINTRLSNTSAPTASSQWRTRLGSFTVALWFLGLTSREAFYRPFSFIELLHCFLLSALFSFTCQVWISPLYILILYILPCIAFTMCLSRRWMFIMVISPLSQCSRSASSVQMDLYNKNPLLDLDYHLMQSCHRASMPSVCCALRLFVFVPVPWLEIADGILHNRVRIYV